MSKTCSEPVSYNTLLLEFTRYALFAAELTAIVRGLARLVLMEGKMSLLAQEERSKRQEARSKIIPPLPPLKGGMGGFFILPVSCLI